MPTLATAATAVGRSCIPTVRINAKIIYASIKHSMIKSSTHPLSRNLSYKNLKAIDSGFTQPLLSNKFMFKRSYYPVPSLTCLKSNHGISDNDGLRSTNVLDGYIRRIAECNFGMSKISEFIPLEVENSIVGYIHKSFLSNLEPYNIFDISNEPGSASHDDAGLGTVPNRARFKSGLESCDLRTTALADALSHLHRHHPSLIPGWRNELYPASTSFDQEPLFLIERAAAPIFGIKQYGVHVNGYVTKENGEIFLWVAKRSKSKQTFPGRLDHIVAGGQPYGLSCKENVIKEAQEEASIPFELSNKAISVGVVNYSNISGINYKRDLLFCYDLLLPSSFVPVNSDGEVESFSILPISDVAKIVRTSDAYKTNCSLVIIDFLIRHGYITPDHEGFLTIINSLRQGL